MTLWKLVLLFGVCCALVVPSLGAQQAAMTNDDVIALAGAELGDDIVIAKIHAAQSTAFDTSLTGLKALKAAGVSSVVIKTMISPKPESAVVSDAPAGDPNDPESFHAPGVYAFVHGSDGDHMVKLAYLVPMQVNLARGLVSGRYWSVLSGDHASVQFQDPNPSFYVYIKNADATTDLIVKGLQIVRLNIKKNTRELAIGWWDGITMKNKPGIDPKAWHGSASGMIKPGIYKITLAKPLEPGEYAFYKAGTWQAGGMEQDGGEFYEFEVGAKP